MPSIPSGAEAKTQHPTGARNLKPWVVWPPSSDDTYVNGSGCDIARMSAPTWLGSAHAYGPVCHLGCLGCRIGSRTACTFPETALSATGDELVRRKTCSGS